MKEMIAYCGLKCHECDIYIATLKNDDETRRVIAERWSEALGIDLKVDDINCAGCLSKEGPLYKHCSQCQVRQCGIEMKVENCAHCKEYVCTKLTHHFTEIPECQDLLKIIKQEITSSNA